MIRQGGRVVMGAPGNKAIQHQRKAKNIERKMELIKAKHPSVIFSDSEMLHDIKDFIALRYKYITEIVDAEMCNSDNINRVCSNCTCLKSK